MSPAPVEIVIDELHLRGVSQAEAGVVAAAIQERLRQLGTDWAHARGTAPRARDEAFRRAPGVGGANGPAQLGSAVADSVWSSAIGGSR